MSKFFSAKYASLTPYTPGEQPKDGQYIKLNTNESPFTLPEHVLTAIVEEGKRLQLYSDPENVRLTEKTAQTLGVKKEQVLMTNGSDDALNFAFTAFCDGDRPACFADITYGFYKVFAQLHGVPYREIPLRDDFSLDKEAFAAADGTLFIANPNAPTGLALSKDEIERIVAANPNRVVVVDEAYVDFGGESCVGLIDRYDNLLVTQTFSKSRSLAGGRLGMAIGNERLVDDLKALKYSTNPYNVNRMTAAAGYAILCEEGWFQTCVRTVCENREYTAAELKKMGFTVLNSKANFLFVKTDGISGEDLYKALKARSVLVRHFNGERIKDYVRVTVGSKEQMEIFLEKTKKILEEEK